MREEKFRKVNLKNVTDEDLEFINNFSEKSKENLEHLIKTPHGVLTVNYIYHEGEYLGVTESRISPR